MTATEDFPVGVNYCVECLVSWMVISDEEKAVLVLIILIIPYLSGNVEWDSLGTAISLVQYPSGITSAKKWNFRSRQ